MIFLDMDDVVASWSEQFKKFNTHWINIYELPKDYHIYLKLIPNYNIINAIESLINNHKQEVCILTASIKDESLFEMITSDKKAWLKKHMPFINLESNFICVRPTSVLSTSVQKVNAAKEYLHRPLSSNDILIDDNHSNMLQWAKDGGCSIQFINYEKHQKVCGSNINKISIKQDEEQLKDAILEIQNNMRKIFS